MKTRSNKLGRRDFVARLGAGGLTLAAVNLTEGCGGGHAATKLENERLALVIDGASGLLTDLHNKLTDQTWRVRGDGFAVVAEEFSLTPRNMHLESVRSKSAESVEARYQDGERSVVVTYKLGEKDHFFEKTLAVTCASPFRLKTLVVGRLGFSGASLKFFRYPYQKNVVYFGRSEKGGVFLGLELPFDASYLDEDEVVTLAYHPSLKVKANELLESEPLYFGVYKRKTGDLDVSDLPLGSESEAMVAMTTTIVGPPRHGLAPLACGWWCEMEHYAFRTEAQVEADLRSIDFLAECGVDWVSDSHPWSGETEKMNALGPGDHYEPSPLVKKFLAYAKEKKVNVVFWPTMNNTHPWWTEQGKPFRADRPDWVMYPKAENLGATIETGFFRSRPENGNCIANEPFFEWLMGIQSDGMRTGYFPGWVMDGDFFGKGGMVLPVDCPSSQHDHLPGDSNYACERALNRMMNRILKEFPGTYMGPMCRPPMDLGIWSNRLADSVFTLDEYGVPQPLRGLGKQPVNVTYGDKIRTWSRLRVQRHFFPHYLDQPQVFVAPKTMGGPDWPSEKIDYVMLSAHSCSPNQLYYLPTKAGIPTRDKAEIRKWLDWGRTNIRYLQVRKDLPQGPAVGKVDGSAHIIADRGLIFLFNPNPATVPGNFRLDTDSIGLTAGARFEITAAYPASPAKRQASLGEEVSWDVPAESCVVLSLAPAA